MNTLKKLIICSAVVLGIYLIQPRESYGQYTTGGYNGGTFINDRIRSRINNRRLAARLAAKRKRASPRKKVVVSKPVRRTRKYKRQ